MKEEIKTREGLVSESIRVTYSDGSTQDIKHGILISFTEMDDTIMVEVACHNINKAMMMSGHEAILKCMKEKGVTPKLPDFMKDVDTKTLALLALLLKK